jgi:hypothetical protein
VFDNPSKFLGNLSVQVTARQRDEGQALRAPHCLPSRQIDVRGIFHTRRHSSAPGVLQTQVFADAVSRMLGVDWTVVANSDVLQRDPTIYFVRKS